MRVVNDRRNGKTLSVARALVFVVMPSAGATLVLACSGGASVRPPPASEESDASSASAVLDAGADRDAASPADAALDAGEADAGPPSFTSSRTELDFGLVGCGRAGAPITFSLNNTGPSPFEWSTLLRAGASSLFTLTPSSGTLAPSGSVTVTVSMADVPYPGRTDPDFYADLITLTARGSGTTSLDLPVKLTARGAIIRLSPTAIVFGSVPLNQASSADFGIVNEGNAEVELNLVSNNTRFAASPLGPVVVAKASTATRSVRFSALDTVPQSGELTFSSTNPANAFCAPLPVAGLSVSGVGSNGAAHVTPASLSFGESGLVDCGTQADSRTVTVENTGNAAFNWTAKLTSGGTFYALSPSSGTVAAGATATFQVVPAPIPQIASVTSDAFAGTVEVTTTAVNDPVHVIQLHETARGAILVSTVGGGTLDFGGVKVGTTSSKQFSVTNNGNVATAVSLAVGSAAYGVTPASVNVAPSQTTAPTLSFTPSAVQPYTDTLVFTTAEGVPRCGPLPGNTTLNGTGTTAVSVAPSSLTFGLVNCGTAAGPQMVTITNTGPAMTFVPTLGKDSTSPYALQNAADGAPLVPGSPLALASGSSYTVRVVPAPITPPASTAANAFGDTLTITTNSPGDAPHVIQLNQTARGAFLSLAPLSLSITDPLCNKHVSFNNVSITNSGNVAIGYDVAAVGRDGTPDKTFSLNVASGALFGGQSQAGILEMVAPLGPNTQYLGDIVLTPGQGVLCSDPQPKMPLSVQTGVCPP